MQVQMSHQSHVPAPPLRRRGWHARLRTVIDPTPMLNWWDMHHEMSRNYFYFTLFCPLGVRKCRIARIFFLLTSSSTCINRRCVHKEGSILPKGCRKIKINNNFNDNKGQEAHQSQYHSIIIIIYSDETILLRCSKAHDTYLLKMYIRCVSVAADSEMNLHLSTLFRWGKAGLRSEQ